MTSERHQVETSELLRQLGCSRDDVAQLQQQLSDAGDRQAALVVELRRMAQQLSSGQMELEASRAIASAQRETILVREAEIARLEARLGLVQRSLQKSATSSSLPVRSRPAGTASSLPDVDLTAVSAVVTCPPPSNAMECHDAGSKSGLELADCDNDQLNESCSRVFDDHVPPDNPDSLLAMWHQLQLNDTIRQSAGDSTTSAAATDRRSTTTNLTTTAATRLGGAFEEKERVQNRIKALIGYREPARKSASAAKPKMSVRPQPLSTGANHSRSITASASVKQPHRRASASDSANSSQLSSAVSHYT